MKLRPVTDLSGLPTYGYGPQSPIWWGTLGFMALEGMGFALAIGAYLYLYHLAPGWPLADRPPNHWPGTLMTAVLLLSAWPNKLVDRAGHEEDLPKVQRLLIVMSVIGLLTLVIRFWEFTQLYVRWDQNAYGSLLWLLLGLHYTHLITDVGDTLVLTALMFTKHARGKRFSDVSDNAFYWYFVIGAWLPMYVLIYWVPRW
ncbi:cytochrome C oxidase subunit III [Alsobacter soli]|uniref:Cytochrome C oxidase subunit III n=1 Tax=Alsobacter soli TaxID=2109933 RepID=A0A2T1HZN9_9HYPH|nr:cytochrome c oxidase subunit 3 [Alsobacter soli]PSC07040.1 cytochrome C oxidase subunit III [Alsobacter soli]